MRLPAQVVALRDGDPAGLAHLAAERRAQEAAASPKRRRRRSSIAGGLGSARGDGEGTTPRVTPRGGGSLTTPRGGMASGRRSGPSPATLRLQRPEDRTLLVKHLEALASSAASAIHVHRARAKTRAPGPEAREDA